MTLVELEQCIDVYGKDIYSFCLHITGSVQEGEDLYQDTFLKAMEHIDKINSAQNPKSFLLSISIKLWKNRVRKYAWRQRIAGMESLDERCNYETGMENRSVAVGDTLFSYTPEMQMVQREQNACVRRYIKELPEKYQVPVYLIYVTELSVKEVADCMKLPEGTVKSRLHKARAILKEKLEVAGYDK